MHRKTLIPRAIGRVRGEVLVVWSNDLFVEVRTERGEVRFTVGEDIERDSAHFTDPMFVGDSLALAITNSIASEGFSVWDVSTGRELLRESLLTDGYPFFTSVGASHLLLVSAAEGIAFWDLNPSKLRLRRVAPERSAEAATFHAPTRRLAYYVHDVVRITHPWMPMVEHEARMSYSIGMTWAREGRVLIVVNGEVSVLLDPVSGQTLGSIPLTGSILCQSDCGRWVAFWHGLVDVETMSMKPHRARAGYFDTKARGFVFVDENSVWRVPI